MTCKLVFLLLLLPQIKLLETLVYRPLCEMISSPPIIYEGSSLYICQYLVFLLFFKFTHLNRCVVISHVVLTTLTLMANDIEHLFTCLFAIFPVKSLLGNFAHFLIGLLEDCLIFESSLYILDNVLCWTHGLQIFPPRL